MEVRQAECQGGGCPSPVVETHIHNSSTWGSEVGGLGHQGQAELYSKVLYFSFTRNFFIEFILIIVPLPQVLSAAPPPPCSLTLFFSLSFKQNKTKSKKKKKNRPKPSKKKQQRKTTQIKVSKSSIRKKKSKQSKTKQKKTTEISWSSFGVGQLSLAWSMPWSVVDKPSDIHWRKLVFPLPASVNCNKQCFE